MKKIRIEIASILSFSIFSLIISFITSLLITRNLIPTEKANLSIITSTVSILSLLVLFGFKTSLPKFFEVKSNENLQLNNKLCFTLMIINIVLTLPLIYYIYNSKNILSVNFFEFVIYIFLIALLSVLHAPIIKNRNINKVNKIKLYLSILNFTILTIFLVFYEFSVEQVIATYIVTHLILILLLNVGEKRQIKNKLKFCDLKNIYLNSTKYFFGGFLIIVIQRLDIQTYTYFNINKNDLGNYLAAQNIYDMLLLLPSIFSTYIFIIAKNISIKKYIFIIYLISLFIYCCTFLFDNFINEIILFIIGNNYKGFEEYTNLILLNTCLNILLLFLMPYMASLGFQKYINIVFTLHIFIYLLIVNLMSLNDIIEMQILIILLNLVSCSLLTSILYNVKNIQSDIH